ncbi:MAG: hypothetical protein WC824_08835 [Bacteroidota bacterium]|jgi:integrase
MTHPFTLQELTALLNAEMPYNHRRVLRALLLTGLTLKVVLSITMNDVLVDGTNIRIRLNGGDVRTYVSSVYLHELLFEGLLHGLLFQMADYPSFPVLLHSISRQAAIATEITPDRFSVSYFNWYNFWEHDDHHPAEPYAALISSVEVVTVKALSKLHALK